MKKEKENKFQTITAENKKRSQRRMLEQIRKQERQNKFEEALFVFIALFIFVMFARVMNSYTNEAITNCVNDGNSYNYCVSKLS